MNILSSKSCQQRDYYCLAGTLLACWLLWPGALIKTQRTKRLKNCTQIRIRLAAYSLERKISTTCTPKILLSGNTTPHLRLFTASAADHSSQQPAYFDMCLLCDRAFQGDPGQQAQTMLDEEHSTASTSIPPILDAIARQPLADPTQPYQDSHSQDTDQQRKARRAQAQRLRRAAQSAEQRAAVAAADAARHAAARCPVLLLLVFGHLYLVPIVHALALPGALDLSFALLHHSWKPRVLCVSVLPPLTPLVQS